MRLTPAAALAAGAALLAGCGERPELAPHSTRLAFTANQGGSYSVALVDPVSGRRVALQSAASSPTWSPDGEQLAFARERADESDIAVMRADGSGTRAVTSGPERDRDPVFSPDGEWIAFTRITTAADGRWRGAIFVVRADGGGLRQVTPGHDLEGEPAWSPDGRSLAFTRMTSPGRMLGARLRVVDVSGGHERSLAAGHDPAWSPDGRRLAYVSARARFGRTCFHECNPSGEIHVVGADGRGDRRLTRSRADEDDPAWAAGGRQIVFSSDLSDPRRHDRELYAMSATGGCVTRLTNASSWSMEPAWRPGAVGTLPCARGGVAAGARTGRSDVGLARARAFSAHPLFWLGRTHRGLLLTYAERFAEGFTFVYDDCRDAGAACPPSVQVQTLSLCWWNEGPARVRLRRVGSERGAPVYAIGAAREVHTGAVAVRVHGVRGEALRAALAALRPLDGEARRRLPRPVRRCR